VQTAVQQQALAAYEKSVLTALEDVENALVSYANNRERQTALRHAAQASRSAAVLARQRYESGITDFQKVLDTERSRLSIEDGLASSEAEGLSALIRLYKALGGGWHDITETSENNPS
jgi:outer membrane protein TolC